VPQLNRIKTTRDQMMVAANSGGLDPKYFPSSHERIRNTSTNVDVAKLWAQELSEEIMDRTRTDSLWELIITPAKLGKKFTNAAQLEQAVSNYYLDDG
jgi:hypothetical protein